MDSLLVNLDPLRLSIRSIIGPNAYSYWNAETVSDFEADFDFGANSDLIPDSFAIPKPIWNPEPSAEPIPEPIPIPKPILEPIPIPETIPEPILEPISKLILEIASEPTIWNRFHKTTDLSGIDSDENSFFPITSWNVKLLKKSSSH